MKLNPLAVIDTNVIANVVTCIDVVNHSNQPGWTVNSLNSRADRVKARQATILSWHLHETRAQTFSLLEARRLIASKVAREAEADERTHFTILWAHYVKDQVLPGWEMTDPALEQPDLAGPQDEVLAELKRRWDLEPKGNDADQLYVDRAKDFDVPLITFEGLRDSGEIDHKCGIRVRAAQAGVTVLTPGEFYSGRDEVSACEAFYQRWRDGAEAFIAQSSHPDVVRDSMATFGGYYLYILHGIVRDQADRLPVTFT